MDLLHSSVHYADIPMSYRAIFHGCKNDNFQLKFFDYFYIFAQNIDCVYSLEPPLWVQVRTASVRRF